MKKLDSHFSIAKLSYLCSMQRGDCETCIVKPVCNKKVEDWPKDPSLKNPPIFTLHDLFEAAQERHIECQCPTLTIKGFTNVQRYLGLRTSVEKESVAIQQKNYPFAHATQMTQSEYTIFAIPYLRWIQERSVDMSSD